MFQNAVLYAINIHNSYCLFKNERYLKLKKKDIRKQKDLPCSLIGKINIVKMLKAGYRFNLLPIKLLIQFI